jgi:hypothetical protein
MQSNDKTGFEGVPTPGFAAGKEVSVKGLPDPKVPFTLILNNAKVTDADLKELAGRGFATSGLGANPITNQQLTALPAEGYLPNA